MTSYLLLTFIFLVAGVIAVPLATRFGLGSVLGYLIAGIAISPVLSALHADADAIQHVAEFGVVMMLFLIGLELAPSRLWSMRAQLFGLGGGQVVLSTAIIAACALAFGQPWTVALAIGLVLSLSSTAIVLQTLGEKGLMASDGGRASFSVLLFQDMAVIPMLALIPLLGLYGRADGDLSASVAEATSDHGLSIDLVGGLAAWQAVCVTVLAIACVIVAGRWLITPLFRYIGAADLRELFTATALMVVIGIALLMTAVGLSPALGTFLAGVVLANSEYRHELESDIEPFKGLLLGVFFMTVGANIDFALLGSDALTIIAMTLALILAKALVLGGLGWVMGVRGADQWLLALCLAQAGEFGFVLLSLTTASGVIPPDLADRLLLVVALSMVITPLLFILWDRIVARGYSEGVTADADEIPEQRRILIAGHGRMGGIVSRMLEASEHEVTVIDVSVQQLELIRKFGRTAYFGDATRPDLLRAAGIEEADLIVIAIDDRDRTTALVKYLHREHPKVHIVARAYDRLHVYELWRAGCRDVVRATYDSSIRMGRSAWEALGIRREVAQRMADAFEVADRQGIRELAEYHAEDVPASENTTYQEKVRERAPVWRRELSKTLVKLRDEGEYQDDDGTR